MRAWKMLYVLFGLMAGALCVLRAAPRATAVAERTASGSGVDRSPQARSEVHVATGSLARLAADPRHSRGDALARQLNSAGTAVPSDAGRPIRGSYALLASEAQRAAATDWVERLIASSTPSRDQATQLPRVFRRQQPLGTWIGWSGCSPYAARRDHLGRPVQAGARASLSFRIPPASPRASVPVVTPARTPSRR